MKNGMFVPATQCKSHPNIKSDGKARVDTGKPTLTQQGIDVDELIDVNRQEIERMRSRTPPTSTGLDSSTPTGPRSTT